MRHAAATTRESMINFSSKREQEIFQSIKQKKMLQRIYMEE